MNPAMKLQELLSGISRKVMRGEAFDNHDLSTLYRVQAELERIGDSICTAVSPFGRKCSRPAGHYRHTEDNDHRYAHQSWDFDLKHMDEAWKEPYPIALTPEQMAFKQNWLTQAKACFEEAGFKIVSIQETPNGYWGPKNFPHMPWLVVETDLLPLLGKIEFGSRKRVYHIQWSEELDIHGKELLKDGEDPPTTWERGIHAWGLQKATEYLLRLRRLVQKRNETSKKMVEELAFPTK